MTTTHDTPLAGYTSLKVGGPAATLIELDNNDDLPSVIGEITDRPLWVLGYGTNCLISDKGLPGTVIMNHAQKIELLSDTRIKASSGTDWDTLVQFAISKGLYGLEFISGVPGGVGAAIVGNIAAYGHKIADTFVEATILDWRTGSVKVWQNADMGFVYRSSHLQNPDNQSLIILDATFELSQSPTSELEYEAALNTAAALGIAPDSLENRRKIILETRSHAGSLLADRQAGPWTAGSFFKNPVVNEDQAKAIIANDETGMSIEKLLRQNQIHSGESIRVSAAHVLLAAGFHRGQSWGQVRLHPDHVLKIENVGSATASEMYSVVQEIISTVRQKLGITLEPEVRILGNF